MDINLHDVVMKLVGPITPQGETHTDNKRYDNLSELIDLTWRLVSEIQSVAVYEKRHEHSMNIAGKKASDALANLYEQIEETPLPTKEVQL